MRHEVLPLLTDTEFESVLGVLTNILAVQGGRAWFGQVFAGPDFPKALSAAAGPTASDEQVAAAAIQVCLDHEWLDKPVCWLERLLAAIRNEGGAGGVGVVADIDQILARVHNEINVLDEVWYHNWLRNDAPFVDRGPLRNALTSFARADGRPILRVEGDPKTGKSYSRELLEYVSQNSRWSFEVVPVEIQEGAGFDINSVRLTQLIVGGMGASPALSESGLPDPAEEDIQLLLNWIWRVASNARKKWWIFLDGFRFVHPRNSARKLIQALAERIANGNYRQWLRLILVDYDEPLSRVDEDDRVAYDRPDPAKADVTAVADCLRQLYSRRGVAVSIPDLMVKAQAIVSALPPGAYFATLYKLVKAAGKSIPHV